MLKIQEISLTKEFFGPQCFPLSDGWGGTPH